MNLAESLRKGGFPVLEDNGSLVVIRSQPALLVGAAGRVRLFIAETLKRVADVRAVYDPANMNAVIHVSVPPSESG